MNSLGTTPCLKQVQGLVQLSVSKVGNSTISLSNLFKYLAILTVEKFFLVPVSHLLSAASYPVPVHLLEEFDSICSSYPPVVFSNKMVEEGIIKDVETLRSLPLACNMIK